MTLTEAGYAEETFGVARIVARDAVLPAVREALRSAGALFAAAARAPDAQALCGRGTAYAARFGAERWVVRHYRRGGAVARFLDDRYPRIGQPRPLRELAASAEARRRGVPTPEIRALVIYPRGAFYRADIATVHIPDSIDFGTLVSPDNPLGARERERAAEGAGRLVGIVFEAGILHRDLNLKNILLQRGDGGPDALWNALLLDLDRAEAVAKLSESQRRQMLNRIDRSWRKLTGGAPEATLLAAFRRGIAAGGQ